MKPHWEEMRKSGMTYQSIADASGVGVTTVKRSVSPNGPTQPDFVTGKDGKKYPAKKTTRLTSVFIKNKRQQEKTTENLKLVNPGGTLEHRQLDRKASTYKREHDIAQLSEDLPDKTERYELYHKSCEEMAEILGPNSVDVIITDPPYPYEFIDTYSELSKTASIVLKPGGSCLALSGHIYLPEIFERLSMYLKYHWVCCELVLGGHNNIHARKLATGWKPLLWFTKGESNNSYIGNDVFKSTGDDKTKHYWGQNYDAFSDIVKAFCKPGHKIFDPFCGGGTTGLAALNNECYFIGSDIDFDSIKMTKNRIAD
jgi:site-specific DNA-methyltransferase (adenine-specific)